MEPTPGENQPSFEVTPNNLGGNSLNLPESQEAGVSKSPENKPQTQSIQVSSQAAADQALPASVIKQTDDAAVSTTHTDDQTPGPPAADTDRIEKEWVDRSKAVINQTQEDPFKQKSEMSKISAQYIKKRFNTTIKTDDAVAK